MITLLGWWIFRGLFRDEATPEAAFASRFFAACIVVETICWAGMMVAIVIAIQHGAG